MNESRKLALVFPQYYGPSLSSYGAALLWFGRLDTLLLPWVSSNPAIIFEQLTARANERQLPIAELFQLTRGWFEQTCLLMRAESIDLEQLGDRVTRLGAVGPGGQLRYREIRQELDFVVEEAFRLLSDPDLLRVAGCQFVWRCYEYYLECSNSCDAVLDALSLEEKVETGKSRLLAECLTNHFASWAPAAGSIILPNRATINILMNIGDRALASSMKLQPTIIVPAQREYLASSLFENTLSNACPPLTSKTCAQYRTVLEKKSDAVEGARRKCYLAADELLDKSNDPPRFSSLLERTIIELESDVREIAEIDKASWTALAGRLLEDRAVWGAIVGFAGGAAGVLPPISLAVAAATLFSSVAARGITQLRSKQKTLRESDWCFVYELKRRPIHLPRNSGAS